MNPIKFLSEVRSELTKVTWPSRKATIEMTVLVLVVSTLIGVYITGLDAGLTRMATFILK